ncbi:Ppx/GppA family phosphatase [Sphingosinicella sp. LHD-64]|uniref:Ppx/GppA family phosphatase n=1 Tax=Sphingosinicella sp. LHD-64 TaxID=3072139 RepID=UPI00280E8319|nr:Ppx/GppA family phosphatase [Sphingosinicella sp. LHD-64]MDQ8754959.1 Ppx/GppA family phosphatase [Sphingosinicella sp. LHD-64]
MFAEAPVAIIDIGSNSVRLVVYSGAKRSPSVIFNEKIMAGLGREIPDTGALGTEAQARALAALARFHLLTQQMGVVLTRTVATAAVREASNGDAFLDQVRAIGLDPHILSGKEEARMAGLGVLSAIPDAEGLVGDLGGGSLELVELSRRAVKRNVSLPLGVLRLDALAREGDAAFARKVVKAVEATGFADAGKGRPFYMVGGSWRALAQLDMALTDHPLPITQQHAMPANRPAALREPLRKLDKDLVREITPVSPSRVPSLPRANQLLVALVETLQPSALVVSSFGIREGLLYDELDRETRKLDPLIEAAREAGAGLGRFAQHGDLLDAWIAPVFDDTPRQARLRLAACLLSDIAWAAHPDFRAERGIDMALHGNWVAIDAPGRVMLAQALFCAFGGGRDLPYPAIAALCTPEELKRAQLWGFAMRLGQRFSGGVATGLENSRLSRRDGALRLRIAQDDAALAGEPVERRLKTLAIELNLRSELQIGR